MGRRTGQSHEGRTAWVAAHGPARACIDGSRRLPCRPKRFRLVVDKEFADNIVGFCGKDVRKTSPTAFEMIANDFVPSTDLSILILTSHLGD